MGENQMLRLAVLQFVARLAERNAVRDVESQFGVFGKGLDVMGVEIPAARIAAPLAGEVVTAVHVEAPPLVLHRKALSSSFGGLAIPVRMALLAAGRSLASDYADLPSRFDAMGNTQAIGWLAFSRKRHPSLCIVSVAHTLKRGHSAAQRRIGIIGRTAGLADRGKSITATLIDVEAVTFNPAAASVAPLKALLNSLLVFLNGYADSFCSSLRCACFASHTNS